MKRLLVLLAFVGTATISGVSYLLLRLEGGVTLEELRDAGLDERCAPALLECDGRVAEECRDLPDGGRRRKYASVRTQAYVCERDAGRPALLFRFPRCFRPLSEDFCRLIDETACSDAQACGEDESGQPKWRAVQQACACRAIGQLCRTVLPDGGLVPMAFGTTYPPPFVGAGCQPKACVELAGEWGESMPSECLP